MSSQQSTDFPFHLPVHLHFSSVSSHLVLFATKMVSQMTNQMIEYFAAPQKKYVGAKGASHFK